MSKQGFFRFFNNKTVDWRQQGEGGVKQSKQWSWVDNMITCRRDDHQDSLATNLSTGEAPEERLGRNTGNP